MRLKTEWLFEQRDCHDVPGRPSSATPTLVQHTASSSSNEQERRHRERLQVHAAHKVLAGNCLILGVTFGANPFSPSMAGHGHHGLVRRHLVQHADVTTTDGGTAFSQIFVHPNASAGLHTITVTLNGS